MGLRFARNLTSKDALEPGEYFTDYLRHPIGGLYTVYLRCKCGCVGALTDKHVVQEGGKVVPAWKCTSETCGVFEFVELEAFGEPVW